MSGASRPSRSTIVGPRWRRVWRALLVAAVAGWVVWAAPVGAVADPTPSQSPCPTHPEQLTHMKIRVTQFEYDALACANLTGSVLDGLDLTQYDLHNANLTGASLKKTDLTQADLVGATLNGANFTGADLGQADLTGAKMRDTVMDGAQLIQTTLSNVKGEGATFRNAKMGQATIHDADLRNANFSGADLGQAELNRSDVTGADFDNADLSDTDVSGAKGFSTPLGSTPPPGTGPIGVGGDDGSQIARGAGATGTGSSSFLSHLGGVGLIVVIVTGGVLVALVVAGVVAAVRGSRRRAYYANFLAGGVPGSVSGSGAGYPQTLMGQPYTPGGDYSPDPAYTPNSTYATPTVYAPGGDDPLWQPGGSGQGDAYHAVEEERRKGFFRN